MIKKISGFTIIEIVVTLIALSLLVGAGLVAIKQFKAQTQRSESESALVAADEALIAYVQLSRRLPCPDSDNDGFENCGTKLGELPYRTLGLDAVPLDGHKRALQYLVNQDLIGASATSDYAFCQSLLARSKAYNFGRLSSDRKVNLIYSIISQGSNEQLSLINFDAANSSYRVSSGNSSGARDDSFRARGFLSLVGAYNCPGIIVALNSIELELSASILTRKTLEFTLVQIDSLIGSAETEKLLAAFSIVGAAGSVASAVGTALDASGQTIFFGNAAAAIAAIAATVAAAAAVVAVVEAILIIDGANADIMSLTAQKLLLDQHIIILNFQCQQLRTVLISKKGGSISCS